MGADISKARQASRRLNNLKITTVEDRKPYLFISYKSDDWELAIEEIAYTMQKLYGLSIYYDRNFEDVNESWVKAMQNHLLSPQCVGVLAFLSRNYVRSYATMLEILTSQQDKCARGGHPMPIISVFLEEAGDLSIYCDQAKDAYFAANTGIKKTEWDALEGCIRNFNLKKNQITPQDVKDACEEIASIEKGSDLGVMSVIDCFEAMEEVVAGNHKDYGGDRFYEMLRNTIADEEGKFVRWKRAVARDPDLQISVFDKSLICEKDLDIPATSGSPAARPEVAEPAQESAVEPVEAPTELPGEERAEEENAPAVQRRKSVTGDVRYTIYGKEYEENQSDMMLRVFAQVLKKHPECVATLPQKTGMNCAARWEDIAKPGTKEAKPSYFRVCRNFTFDNGASLCIGTAYDSKEKLRKIALLLEHCGESRDVFQSQQVELPELGNKHPGRPAAKVPEDKPSRAKKEKNFMD